jgi:nitrogen fixation/metabolism regulation signal transduction histidine kinase
MPQRLRFDQRILLLALAAGFPAAVVSLVLLWTGNYTARVQWTLTVLLVGIWLGCSFAARHRVVLPLQTLSNLLAALRERDFSIRARGAGGRAALTGEDPLAAVMLEVNELAATLHDQRLGAIEAGALLRTVMVEIDVAVFTFDVDQLLRLVNRAGERLLGKPAEALLGRTAGELGLASCLEGATPRIEDVSFPGATGRWEMRRTTFRQEGRPHQLLVLADVSRPLRDEERQAWQRLIRVIGHEINNSLTPIKSIAGSLLSLLNRMPRPADADDDLRGGLGIIGARSEALSRFMSSYALLARLPAPKPGPVDVGIWARRAAGLETRVSVQVSAGPSLIIQADGDQLDQLLINLVRNAADASLETGGSVSLSWMRQDGHVDVEVADEGPGLATTANLFVPFYTTKPSGTGIGLVLCRQIAEAHGGVLSLENRGDRRGCVTRVRLPVTFRDTLG